MHPLPLCVQIIYTSAIEQYIRQVAHYEGNHIHLYSFPSNIYRMRLNFLGTKFSQFLRSGTPSAHSFSCEYFEQVLQNHKNGRRRAPCTAIAIVLDRKYKYGRHFIRYQLVTKFS